MPIKKFIEKIKVGILDYIQEKIIEEKGLQGYPGVGIPLSNPVVDIPSAIYTFLKLTDCPVTYTGQAGKYPKVKTTEDGLEFGTISGAGGDYGINVETLSGNKTLTANTDKLYQYLDPDGADRVITLATSGVVTGDRFIIRNNSTYYLDTNYLEIKQSTTTLDKIYSETIKEFIFDGTNWVCGESGSGDTDTYKRRNVSYGYLAKGYYAGVAIGSSAIGYKYGVAIGYDADGFDYAVGIGESAYAYNYGVAVGKSSRGYDYGVAIGQTAYGYEHGVAVGDRAKGFNYGVGLGKLTDSGNKKYSVALGYQTICHRTSEVCHNISGGSTQNKITNAGWKGSTANATLTEIFLGSISNERFTIQSSSVLYFKIMIVARDVTNQDVAAYKVEGVIKRDGSNNTTLVNSTKTIIYEDDASWDITVSADDTNEALVIKVNGDASHSVIWGAKLEGIEVII